MTSIIETRRKALRLSQEKIAKRLGVTRQYYNTIENCKCTPSVKLAKELANILQIEWTIFFEDKVNI